MDRTRAKAAPWIVGVALLAAVVSGCAKPGTVSPGTGGTVQPSISPTGLSMSPTGKPDVSTPLTVSGVMRAGVEAKCMVLTTDAGAQYQLLGGDPGLVKLGARLTVTGYVTKGISTTCMQGTLLTVTNVETAS